MNTDANKTPPSTLLVTVRYDDEGEAVEFAVWPTGAASEIFDPEWFVNETDTTEEAALMADEVRDQTGVRPKVIWVT